MPRVWATRRASSTSATEQHPESDAPPQSLSVAPVTSWPASIKRAAATEESTPPLIATRTFTLSVCQAPPTSTPVRVGVEVPVAYDTGEPGVTFGVESTDGEAADRPL